MVDIPISKGPSKLCDKMVSGEKDSLINVKKSSKLKRTL